MLFICITQHNVFNPKTAPHHHHHQVLILVVDLIMGNYNCEAIPLCANDIADPLCQCVTGDFFKLPVLTEQEHGSPFIGILITLGLYLGLMVLSTILLYLYTMWIFMNQKIRDLYWRVHAAHDAFFLPEDLEVGPHSRSFTMSFFILRKLHVLCLLVRFLVVAGQHGRAGVDYESCQKMDWSEQLESEGDVYYIHFICSDVNLTATNTFSCACVVCLVRAHDKCR